MKLNASHRLLAATMVIAGDPIAEPAVRFSKAKRVYEDMRKIGMPVTFNTIDYTIGFRCESARMWRVLKLLGFHQVTDYRDPDHVKSWAFRRDEDLIRLLEPREGWDPIIQILH